MKTGYRALYLCLVAIPAVAGAQTRASVCPEQSGIVISSSPAEPKDGAMPEFRLSSGNSVIDTTWIFNTTEKTWQQPQLQAVITAGVNSSVQNGTASASAPRLKGPLSACVGISVTMDQPTLVVKGARGQMHFRADITQLLHSVEAAGRATTAETRR